ELTATTFLFMLTSVCACLAWCGATCQNITGNVECVLCSQNRLRSLRGLFQVYVRFHVRVTSLVQSSPTCHPHNTALRVGPTLRRRSCPRANPGRESRSGTCEDSIGEGPSQAILCLALR